MTFHALDFGAAVPVGSAPTPTFVRHRPFLVSIPDMVARVASHGTEDTIPAGDFLYRRGDRDADFFVVLDGEVETSAEGSNRERNVFARQRASQFTGETTLLNGRVVARFNSGSAVRHA